MEAALLLRLRLAVTLSLSLVSVVSSVTDPNDLAILGEFRKGLENPELLKWPADGGDPCGSPAWPHLVCSEGRVEQINVMKLGLRGPLPHNLNQLSRLTHLSLQNNQFNGKLPSLSGLSQLQYAYLDYNSFDTIPSDFFKGLVNLEVLALDGNPLNSTTGWSLPNDLQDSAQLINLTLMNCNLAGPLPEFLGNMSSLEVLLLSMNRLSGAIPGSFKDSMLKMLWLNDQSGEKMSGPIDVVATMTSLTSLWLHGNSFSGKIPEGVGNLTYLQDLNLNTNNLVGLIPDSLVDMPLDHIDLNNNHFMGPLPKFKAKNVTCESNPFCQTQPGAPCAPEVVSLLEFLDQVNYPSKLVESWSGNDPCAGPWWGLDCDANRKVIVINLPKSNLSGALSPSIANLDSLTHIYLGSNNLSGPIPQSWAGLKSLEVLDLSNNNLSPPLPHFNNLSSMKLLLDGNSLFNSNSNPSGKNNTSSGGSSVPTKGSSSSDVERKSSTKSRIAVVVAPVASFALLVFLAVPMSIYACKKRNNDRSLQAPPASLVIHPRDPSDSDRVVKIAVASNTNGSVSSLTGSGSAITGKITTKADVFSFGVVLMELMTGMMAIDEDRPEESQYLVTWFWNVKSSKERLMAAIDPTLDAKEDALDSILTIAELAGHCTAREPSQRPDMGHAVNVLAPLVEKWRPIDDDPEEYCGIDYSLPLNQMVKGWQESEGKDTSYMDLGDSKGSIPARPTGFAESFTSADGR
nr:receptor-like protein kinase 2.33 [Ipomoea batatas]